MIKATLTALGAVGAAVGSALCCAGPLVAVTLGVSGAGLSSTFEPLRPYFLGATGLFLFGGFYLVDREERIACDTDKPCADPKVRKRTKAMLWIATAIAAVAATYPTWSEWVL
jgi:mercuric ion transport protein